MQQLKFFKTNSEIKITYINLNIKILNKLARRILMAEKIRRAQNIVAKQPIEFLNYSNFNPKGDL